MANPFFQAYDDKSNLINQGINNLINKSSASGAQKGDSKNIDSNFTKAPKGFTPPVDFYVNPTNLDLETLKPVEYGKSLIKGDKSVNSELIDADGNKAKTLGNGKVKLENLVPITEEYGNKITPSGTEGTTPDSKNKTKLESYDLFKDFGGKQFTHLLDYFIDKNGSPVVPRTPSTDANNEIYLGSFIRTSDDNEDPTMLGYDIVIKYDQSPLFNGTIDTFIDTFGKFNKEIKSRKSALFNFKRQIFRFLKNNSDVSTDAPQFITTNGVKVYYLKSLSGLNTLTESLDSEKNKAFIDYGKDVMTLGFNEDVSQNIGYLSSLYKALSWSRIHGKQIIPDNLLKFDVDITITEIRKYNRIFKDSANAGKLDSYVDLISKYTYTLYECQFMFTDLPHGDELKMSEPALLETYNVRFSYKFSTMKFTKFAYNGNDGQNETFGEYIIDNARKDIDEIKPSDTNLALFGENQSISLEAPITPLTKTKTADSSSRGSQEETPIPTPIKPLSFKEKLALGISKAFDKLKGDLKNIAVAQINNQILTQAGLLNKTLNNIYNNIPIVGGGMSAPKNVYSKYDQNLSNLQNSTVNALKNFVGNSVRGFFQNP